MMKQITKILLCSHPEVTRQEIVDYAAKIAMSSQAAIKVFHVIAALPGIGGRIDLSPNNLPAKILESAAAIASLTESKLSIVHALPKYGSNGIERNSKLQPDLTKTVDGIRDKILEDCRACLSGYDISLKPKQVHLLIGKPSEAIPEFTQSVGADVIVMGTVARSGIPGLVYGNTAEKVLQGVNCSILAVKPDEFVSPVTVEDQASSTHVN